MLSTRLEWGPRAIDVFQAWADVIVVIDVLSFSSAVDVAVSRGAAVLPCADDQAAGLAFAGPVIVAGCLRNAQAVGAHAASVGSKIGVLAAGER